MCDPFLRDRHTERLAHGLRTTVFPPGVQRAAARKLRMIEAAVAVQDLSSPPGNRLERLKGNRSGQFSIRVNDQWRICFRWEGQYAYDVELCDYH